jgi:Helix-turn-helix domain
MAQTLGTFEAAKLFDVPPTRLVFLIAQGRIKAEKIDGKWAINRKSLEEWNRKRQEWKARRGTSSSSSVEVRAGA